jgi:hypothetical protein
LEQTVADQAGSWHDAAFQYGSIFSRAKTCDGLKDRLDALADKLTAWNKQSGEPPVDVAQVAQQIAAQPTQPLIPPPPDTTNGGEDTSSFVPDYAYLPPALAPAFPDNSPVGTTTVTIKNTRNSVFDKILQILSGGLAFGGSRITTTETMGRTINSVDSLGKALPGMVASVPADRPDRLSRLWLQLRMLANAPDTPADQRKVIEDFLTDQGQVELLCDYVTMSAAPRIGKEVAAQVHVDINVGDIIKSISGPDWLAARNAVEACVFDRDPNHFAAYRKALDDLDSLRKETTQ